MTEPPSDLPEHFTDADRTVAREYEVRSEKGEIVDGKRLTIMAERSTYRIDEEVRVIHAFEATEPGVELYVMGPKPVYGEYVDGTLATDPAPEWDEPWIPAIYDGPVLDGPGVDFNYEIETYRFSEPGRHEIVWRLDPLVSNTLVIECSIADQS